jgi:hypothetical protein
MSSMMDLAALVRGGGGPPPPGGVTGEDDSGPETDTDQKFANSLDALDAAEEALHAFIQLDPDEGDRAVAAKALQTVLMLKASNQKSSQAGDMKSLHRAIIGGPGATAGPIGRAAIGGPGAPIGG